MAKQSFISHTVNGYSRYDVPESKAFTCTPGVLYPVRVDFINARDRVSIDQGIDVRSNPLAVPTFNPYTVRLHRFWVPLQLYHPELRTNSSKFDMNSLSLNWVPTAGNMNVSYPAPNSLLCWLRYTNRSTLTTIGGIPIDSTSLPSSAITGYWANCDTYLAYWDIVRNYYSYSQWGLYSIAFPGPYSLRNTTSTSAVMDSTASISRTFTQAYCNLEYLDAYFESQFYPSAVSSTNNTFNRANLFYQILASNLQSSGASSGNGYPVAATFETALKSSSFSFQNWWSTGPAPADAQTITNMSVLFLCYHPMAVVPSSPDRFSRLLPTGSNSAVSTTGVTTIPQLAIASRLQEYKDLLGAGGSRYSDWLETFFASKIEHVDRPKLLFSASQTVNVQIVMNHAGQSNFSGVSFDNPLGQQGGSIAFNAKLGRRQSYYFREPGYMIDMLSIRPVYYWSSIRPDYLNYQGADYFNPIYNDIGYQSVPSSLFTLPSSSSYAISVANEPCFNEFRSSYDEVLGSLQVFQANSPVGAEYAPLYSYWVQQRSIGYFSEFGNASATSYYPALFVDMSQVNSPFASNAEDNFIINLSYSVQKKNLVNKTFATRLSNR